MLETHHQLDRHHLHKYRKAHALLCNRSINQKEEFTKNSV